MTKKCSVLGKTTAAALGVLLLAAPAFAGNGAPSGAHYNLNIIGVSNPKTTEMSNDGHRIFVPLKGAAKINLREGATFQVLDANGTDGKAAFQLPNPDPDNDGMTAYSVWARALGKPGGSSTTTTCFSDTTTFEDYCSLYQMVMVRDSGKSAFADVSKELLYAYVDLNADGVVERVPLFSSTLYDFYWSYQNNGLKLVQLRFYPVESTVPAP